MDLREKTLAVHQRIAEQNAVPDDNAIPHSDVFFRETESILGIDLPDQKKIITILKDSHFILTIEIVKEDRKNDIKRVEGYVNATLPNVLALKNYFQKALMDRYEREYKQRLMVHQIVKEIYSRGASFMNTPLGQLANKAIMLEEYEHLIEKEFQEFTDAWKDKKLDEIIEIYESKSVKDRKSKEKPEEKKTDAESDVKRAVDTKEYHDLIQGEHRSMKKMINIYGVEFFFRVNLRNCNFENLALAIENKEIHRRTDLRMLKEMIAKMKINMENDSKLAENSENLRKLERLISRRS